MEDNAGLPGGTRAGMTTLGPIRNGLGEGPWWSVADQRLYWVDIFARRVHRSDLAGTDHHWWSVPGDVGCAVPADDGTILVALRDGLAVLDPKSGATSTLAPLESDSPRQRFNDGKTDRLGRLWFGSMHDDGNRSVGALYRYDGRGDPLVVERGVQTSNGIGWSPDGALMYFTDSLRREIGCYDFDVVKGAISNRRVFATLAGPSLFDGLTVDAEGCVWTAIWDGGRVIRYVPDGSIDRVVEMPVRRPTSCAFAGPDLDILVVTSAVDREVRRIPHDLSSLQGAIFLIPVDVRGLPETRFRFSQS